FDRSGMHYDKPIDKKSNYVKRAVGIPGDSLEIIDGRIHINGEALQLPERAKAQFSYLGTTKGQGFSGQQLYETYGITDGFGYDPNTNQFYIKALTEEAFERFKNHPNVASIERFVSQNKEKEPSIFPNNNKVDWNRDNMGPIYIPKKGETISMNLSNFSLYRRVIEIYEGKEMGIDNTLSVNG